MRRAVVVSALAFALAACGLGVSRTPDMWDRLCELLPEYREARAADLDDRAASIAEDVVDAIPEASLEASSESFQYVLRAAAEAATDGDFEQLDPLAQANCQD